MDKENSRNTIVFVVLAVLMLVGYQFFVLGPSAKRQQQAAQERAAAAAANGMTVLPDGRMAPNAASRIVSRDEALKLSPRAKIDSPALSGSVALQGGRIDDLFLKQYRVDLAPTSPPVELFRPEGARQAYFAAFGWAGPASVPTSQSLWTQTGGATLSPGKPIALRFDNGQGLVFTRTIAVDDRYMFTVTDTVINRGAQPVKLAPYASVQRQGQPQLSPSAIIHEGAVGALDDKLQMVTYKKWKSQGLIAKPSTGGWLGLTDKYWLAAVIPDQKTGVQGMFRVTPDKGVDIYEANYTGAAANVGPGQQAVVTHRLFAGAKKVSILEDYEKALGIPRLEDAIDWGNLEFWLTKPAFKLLAFFQSHVGNFGIAILLLTVVIKAIMFPLANRQFASMAELKKLQPKMEALKTKYKDDPAKLQQETMLLYQQEKVNPLAGCLPVLITIPVFYSLFKMLSVTIEMRHAPFFGWIHDLSAPDPTTIWNLFGLIPYDPSAVPLIGGLLGGALAIGAWPILYGATMWLTTQMSPTPTADPTQKLIFQLMPIIFTFTMAHFVVGLVIYYCWSNILTVLQQYIIMHRHKSENLIDTLIDRLRGKPPKKA